MTGKKFLKLLANRSIPCSALALKAKTKVEKIYALKEKNQVPSKYVVVLVNSFSEQLEDKDIQALIDEAA